MTIPKYHGPADSIRIEKENKQAAPMDGVKPGSKRKKNTDESIAVI